MAERSASRAGSVETTSKRAFSQGPGSRPQPEPETTPEPGTHRKQQSSVGGQTAMHPSATIEEQPEPTAEPTVMQPEDLADVVPTMRTRDGRLDHMESHIVALARGVTDLDNDRKRWQAQARAARSGSWVTKSSRVIREELAQLEGAVRGWAEKHSVPGMAAMTSGSPEGYQRIMERLKGHCTETDWTTLTEKLGKTTAHVPTLLTQALLARDLFGSIFANPFFAFGESQEPSVAHEPRSFSFLYASMLEVNKEEAHIWRSQMLRLLATPPPNSVHNAPLREQVETTTTRLAAEFLDGPVQPLLQTTNESGMVQRTQELHQLYQGAGELAVSLWTQRSFVKCYRIEELSVFRADHPIMSPHPLHHAEAGGGASDGQPVLLMVHPAVVAFGNEYAEHYDLCKVWAKAMMVVDSHA
ncbi:hypothetical protein BDV25DRAFT_130078 [Aspergillus avenaceus]|uniref:Uncharacterized protein n=1 Tax=Aspergillus avenaceus TaxID=36643 RepID=A0A5N6TTV6_ASPAV|nr:hypothetical protein BDV25DRAFT_130078 [Aspergillus avenaceus]